MAASILGDPEDVRIRRTSKFLPMRNSIGSYSESGDVVLDQFFSPDHLVAKMIHVGVAGDLRALSGYTLEGVPLFQIVRNAEIGYHGMICIMVVSAGTTAGALTWHTGE